MTDAVKVGFVPFSTTPRGILVVFCDDSLKLGAATRKALGGAADLVRALELDERHSDLGLGLVDAVVMAMAERLGARAIATLDLRDFAAVQLQGNPELWPRDL